VLDPQAYYTAPLQLVLDDEHSGRGAQPLATHAGNRLRGGAGHCYRPRLPLASPA
jgi:hypothetical protein